MGRGEDASRLFFVHDETVTVGNACIQLEGRLVKCLFQGLYEFVCFLRGDLSCRIVEHNFLFVGLVVRERHKIAAIGHVGIGERNPDGCRLKRRTSRIELFGVISHDGEIGDIAAGGKTRRNRSDKSDGALFCQFVKEWCTRNLHAGAVFAVGERITRHAVS